MARISGRTARAQQTNQNEEERKNRIGASHDKHHMVYGKTKVRENENLRIGPRALFGGFIRGVLLDELVDDQTGAELRLEPRGLWWHDIARVSDINQLLHRDRVECKSKLHLSAIDSLLQLSETTDTTDEVDALV